MGLAVRCLCSACFLDRSLVVEISWWDARSHFSTGALNSLVFGGDIAVIENSALRRLVADWPSQIEYVELAQRQDYDFFFNVWTPFLRANIYLPQQSTLGASMPGIPNLYRIFGRNSK